MTVFTDLPKWLRVTTDAHRNEYVELFKEHSDTLMHVGGEMYRHGLIDGVAYTLISAALIAGV